jgi:hypothetical protein
MRERPPPDDHVQAVASTAPSWAAAIPSPWGHWSQAAALFAPSPGLASLAWDPGWAAGCSDEDFGRGSTSGGEGLADDRRSGPGATGWDLNTLVQLEILRTFGV